MQGAKIVIAARAPLIAAAGMAGRNARRAERNPTVGIEAEHLTVAGAQLLPRLDRQSACAERPPLVERARHDQGRG